MCVAHLLPVLLCTIQASNICTIPEEQQEDASAGQGASQIGCTAEGTPLVELSQPKTDEPISIPNFPLASRLFCRSAPARLALVSIHTVHDASQMQGEWSS